MQKRDKKNVQQRLSFLCIPRRPSRARGRGNENKIGGDLSITYRAFFLKRSGYLRLAISQHFEHIFIGINCLAFYCIMLKIALIAREKACMAAYFEAVHFHSLIQREFLVASYIFKREFVRPSVGPTVTSSLRRAPGSCDRQYR